jgi:hypothetical protein
MSAAGKPNTDRPMPPDLQAWIAKYGGYHKIPWAEWDAAVAAYQRERRDVLIAEIETNKQRQRSAGGERQATTETKPRTSNRATNHRKHRRAQ